MTIYELDKKLNNALIEFSEEMRSHFDEGDSTPATKDDIHTLARSTFYTMDTFRKEIIEYLSKINNYSAQSAFFSWLLFFSVNFHLQS